MVAAPSPSRPGRRRSAGPVSVPGGPRRPGRGWGIASAHVLIVLALLGIAAAATVRGGPDFWSFWAAARLAHRGLDPYQLGNLAAIPLPPSMVDRLPFFSPPYFIPWVAPLAGLPFAAAAHLWSAASVAALAVLVVLLLRLARVPLTLRSAALGMAAACALIPLWTDLAMGQTDLFIVLAIAASWWSLARGRPFLAGLLLAPGLADPQLLTGVALYYTVRAVTRRETRLLGGMAAAGAVALATSLVHGSLVRDWLTVGLPNAQRLAVAFWRQMTLLRLTTVLATGRWSWGAAPPTPTSLVPIIESARVSVPALGATAAVSLAAIAGAVGLWASRTRRPESLEFALAALLTVFTATFAYAQDYLLLVLLAPAVAEWWPGAGPGRRLAMAATLAALFAALTLTASSGTVLVVCAALGAGIALHEAWRARRLSGAGAGALFGLAVAAAAGTAAGRWTDPLPAVAAALVAVAVVGVLLGIPRRGGRAPRSAAARPADAPPSPDPRP